VRHGRCHAPRGRRHSPRTEFRSVRAARNRAGRPARSRRPWPGCSEPRRSPPDRSEPGRHRRGPTPNHRMTGYGRPRIRPGTAPARSMTGRRTARVSPGAGDRVHDRILASVQGTHVNDAGSRPSVPFDPPDRSIGCSHRSASFAGGVNRPVADRTRTARVPRSWGREPVRRPHAGAGISTRSEPRTCGAGPRTAPVRQDGTQGTERQERNT
jgi:hypothetical protein